MTTDTLATAFEHGVLEGRRYPDPSANVLNPYPQNPGEYRADARALWAVRVLDAHGRQSGACPIGPVPEWDRLSPPLSPKVTGRFEISGARGPFADEDAARIAAALAVLPSLPADVRAKLGECP